MKDQRTVYDLLPDGEAETLYIVKKYQGRRRGARNKRSVDDAQASA